MTDIRYTWADIERAAINCPFLHEAVTLVKHGAKKEEALIMVALGLSEDRANYIKREKERLQKAGPLYPALLEQTLQEILARFPTNEVLAEITPPEAIDVRHAHFGNGYATVAEVYRWRKVLLPKFPPDCRENYELKTTQHHTACDPGWGPRNYRCHPECKVGK